MLGNLFLAGVVGVAAYNWWRWRRERDLADRPGTGCPSPARTPRISALVAAWNEGHDIDEHIGSFLRLRYPDIELILCAGGADGTLERARSYACERITILEQQPADGKQRALARCLEHASGEIVYFTDADCLFTDEALLRLLVPLVQDGEQAATGSVRPLDTQREDVLPSYLDAVHVASSVGRARYIDGLQGANAVIWRHALDRSGGLDFTASIGTDYQLARRLRNAGIKIRYVRASVVPTRYPETVGSYVCRQSRWLRTVLVHAPRRTAHREIIAASTTIGVGALMVGGPLFLFVFGGVTLLVWSLLFAHATASKLRYVFLAARLRGRTPSTRLLVSLPLLTLLDFATWTMPAIELLSSKKRRRW